MEAFKFDKNEVAKVLWNTLYRRNDKKPGWIRSFWNIKWSNSAVIMQRVVIHIIQADSLHKFNIIIFSQ